MTYVLRILLSAAILFNIGGAFFPETMQAENLTAQQIDEYTEGMMEEVSLPGISVAIVNGDQTYVKGYGYSDLNQREAVTPGTLFELGSNSKAFTAVGLLTLVEQGKISLEDPITRYLPWFHMKYKGAASSQTVGHFLYQTSGLSSDSVTLMEPFTDEQALERTVRSFTNLPLLYEPGEQFLYSTGNYDVLGAVIAEATGMSYESFMTTQVMQPLGLVNSYVGQEAVVGRKGMSKGYKLGFTGNGSYKAPTYQGNTPAGYIISSGDDMARWLKIQLGQEVVPPDLQRAVRRTHVPNEAVDAVEAPPYTSPFRYGGGWLIFGKNQGLISHGGNNPNFSSYIMVNPSEKIGIAVMGNRNTSYTYAICQGLYALIHGQQPVAAPTDTPYYANVVAIIILSMSLLLGVWFIYKLLKTRRDILAGNRIRETRPQIVLRTGIILGILVAVTGFIVWMLPKLLFWGYPWSFVRIWAPFTLLPSMISIFVMVVLFSIYRITVRIYPLPQRGKISI